jgi:hypothetical protein
VFDSKVKGLSTPPALSLSQANTASTWTMNKTVNLCPTEVQKPGAESTQRSKACMRNLSEQMSRVQHVLRPAPWEYEQQTYYSNSYFEPLRLLDTEELPPFNFCSLDLNFEEVLPLNSFVSERSLCSSSRSLDEFSPLGDMLNPLSSMY